MSVGTSSIAANVEAVHERIARAAERARRRPNEVTLVAISKAFPVESIRQAHAAGVEHFGENRVQEWEQKQPLLADLDATWHLVGHLQSNKAARAVRLFHTVDSLDSLSLGQKLACAVVRISAANPDSGAETGLASSSTGLRVLIEVRLSPEETKSGVTEAELPGLAEGVLALGNLDLSGLMCIPPYLDHPEQVRPFFRRLRELRDALVARLRVPLPGLSMGMSHDFEVAVEEGATEVRLGTAIFGPRASR